MSDPRDNPVLGVQFVPSNLRSRPKPDPDAAINVDPEENRAMARHELEMYRQTFLTSAGAVLEIGKWLLTSLLAINGAAAIATWQIAMNPSYKIAACALFVLGILSAMLCGFLQITGSKAMLAPLGTHIGYWVTVEHDGIRSAEVEDTSDLEASVKKGTLRPTIAGWFAVLFFIGGVVIAGAGGMDEHAAKAAAARR